MKKRLTIHLVFTIFIAVSTIISMILINSGFKEIQIELDEEYNELFTKEYLHKNEHVALIKKYIAENSIGFLNLDGTKTLYVYASPIHFRDINGNWKMIDTRITNVLNNELREKGYIYGVAENDIQSYFSKELSIEKGFLIKKILYLNLEFIMIIP